MKRLLIVVGLALLGLGVAVGITMAASSLSNQTIGISAEPLDAGADLGVPEETPTARATRELTPQGTPDADDTPEPFSTSGGSDDSGSHDSGSDDNRNGLDDSGSGHDDSGSGRDDSGSGSSGSDDSGSDSDDD